MVAVKKGLTEEMKFEQILDVCSSSNETAWEDLCDLFIEHN